MKYILLFGMVACFGITTYPQHVKTAYHVVKAPALQDVKINDSFWSPKLAVWRSKTIYDVFDKFEGKYVSERKQLVDDEQKIGRTRNAFLNFDLVAQGKKGIGQHDGPEWYDGLVYESIRAAGDLLAEYPDSVLESRVDGYIERIAAAQAADPDGYVLTHTILMEPNHRWGLNGGFERGQHDLYDAGMLTEAAVHYYYGTGKTRLLTVAVKLCNFMCREMGPAPKKNIIPGHAGPEEALMKLYWLFKEKPVLKKTIPEPVNENNYYALVKWWIEGRGEHCGLPDWDHWDYRRADRWVRDAKYQDPKFGTHSRPAWGSYDQDQSSVFKQSTIEGHAVRATLLAAGIAATALENKDSRYINTANNYWNNMAGKRMFITGGVGTFAHDEAFGPDYILPEGAYLETCAAVGAAFFSQRMNQLEAKGVYIDEFERSLYNNVLSGISVSGDHYYYENPLSSSGRQRWNWHECPCCPPMFLKIMAALPGYIYAYDKNGIYLNLFIGSDAAFSLKGTSVHVSQKTQYPFVGKSVFTVNPTIATDFEIHVRIPGWANGKENAYDLYHSDLSARAALKVNGKAIKFVVTDGYVTIHRKWKKGDKIELDLPVQPRFVASNDKVDSLKGKLAVAAGPLVYCFEMVDNPDLENISLDGNSAMQLNFQSKLLNGTTLITGAAKNSKGQQVKFTALPFYLVGNRAPYSPYKVWLPMEGKKNE